MEKQESELVPKRGWGKDSLIAHALSRMLKQLKSIKLNVSLLYIVSLL